MAERRIDVSRLGGNAVKLKGTSIEFIEEDSKMLGVINNHIVEGNGNVIQVRKEESGNYRPFLVMENDVLHARLAVYMSLSFDEERMRVDNAIRGEHIFKTPYALASYIGSSTIKGTHDKNKISIIDRDRFLFFNEDSFVDMQSRAKEKDEFAISLSRHARNIQNIDELLSKDLREYNFVNTILDGRADLWTFKRGQGAPIIYNPTAMYLQLFINASVGYKNEKFNLSPRSLRIMSVATRSAIKAYSDYLEFFTAMQKLEIEFPELYKALQNVRYYHNMITPSVYKAMEHNAQKFTFRKYEWRHIYGEPVEYKKIDLEERIKIELGRQKLSVKSNKLTERIMEFIKWENALQPKLAESADNIIFILSEINDEERIMLTDFPYQERFWNDFYEKCLSKDYVQELCADVKGRYLQLEHYHEQQLEKLKAERKTNRRTAKEVERQKEEIKASLQKRTKELIRILDEHHFELYGRAFNQYKEGKLLPLSQDELAKFRTLTQPTDTQNMNFELGQGIVERLNAELRAMESMASMVEASVNLALTAQNRIAELEKTPGAEKLIELMGQIVSAEQRITKQNKGLIAKQRRPLVKKAIVELVQNMDEEELMEYLDPDFDYGRRDEEILTSIQDIYQTRSTLKAYLALKQNKLAVIDAIAELNSPELISQFGSATEAIGELSASGANLPILIMTQSYDSIKTELAEINARLDTKKMQPQDYQYLINTIQEKINKIKEFSDYAKKLIDARKSFYLLLEDYSKAIEAIDKDLEIVMDDIIETKVKEVEERLSDPSNIGYEKDGNSWVQKSDDGKLLDRLTQEQLDDALSKYVEANKGCIDPEIFTDIKRDKQILERATGLVFPKKEMFVNEIKHSVATATGIKDAVKRYENGEKQIKKLIEEISYYKSIVKAEYDNFIDCAQDVEESKGAWLSMFKMMRRCVAMYNEEDFDDNEACEFMNGAIVKSLDLVEEQVERDCEIYRDKIRDRMEEIIDAMEPRTSAISSEAYLSKSVIKNLTWNGVPMPRALIGNNGVSCTIESVAYSKRKSCNLLSMFLRNLNSEIRLEDVAEEESTEEKFDTVDLKPAEYRMVEGCTTGLARRFFDEILIEENKRIASEVKLQILESARVFGLRGNAEKIFIMSKDGLEKQFRETLGQHSNVARIPTPYPVRNRSKEVEGVDYINYIDTLMNNWDLVRSSLESNTPIEGGSAQKYVIKAIDALYRLSTAKTDSEKLMISLSLEVDDD